MSTDRTMNETGVYHVEPARWIGKFVFETGGASTKSCSTQEEAEMFVKEAQERNDKFWLDRIELLADAQSHYKYPIIDGYFWSIGDANPGRGMGGRKFTIIFSDGTEIETTDLWSGGKIPRKFLMHFPDNATFKGGEKWQTTGGVSYFG